MKKILAIFVVLGAVMQTGAQTINDVVRFGMDDLQGTARYRGMSGAFGALGGDLSALNNNPAGSAVFNNSSLTVSGTSYNTRNRTNYFDGNTRTNISDFDLNQLGGVLVFNNTRSQSAWNRFSLAFNYERVNNFENEFLAAGNSNRSLDEYFLHYAQGVPLGELGIFSNESLADAYLGIGSAYGFGHQQAFLGYYGGLIDPVSDNDNNRDYVPTGRYNNGTVNQQFFQNTTGYNNKFTVNMAGQFMDNFYIGASLNFHDIQFDKYTQMDETGYASNSPLQNAHFDNLQRTYGSAFSLSLGGIARLGDMVRVGATYQSPTWYRLTDELSQRIESNLEDTDIYQVDFNLVNVYPDHRIQIPSKYTGSLAVIFARQGLLSFDYSYQDMSNAKLKPVSDPGFASENSYISNTLRAVSTFRLGGEYKVERVSFRGGYRFEQSPYNNDMMGDLQGYSLGIGYDFGAARLDAAFSQYMRDYRSEFYDGGLVGAAAIDSRNTNVVLSLTFNL